MERLQRAALPGEATSIGLIHLTLQCDCAPSIKVSFPRPATECSRLLYSAIHVVVVVSLLLKFPAHRPVGLAVKASASRAADALFDSRLGRGDFFPGRVIPVT